MPQHTREGQRAICRSLSIPSNMWVLRIKLRSARLVTSDILPALILNSWEKEKRKRKITKPSLMEKMC